MASLTTFSFAVPLAGIIIVRMKIVTPVAQTVCLIHYETSYQVLAVQPAQHLLDHARMSQLLWSNIQQFGTAVFSCGKQSLRDLPLFGLIVLSGIQKDRLNTDRSERMRLLLDQRQQLRDNDR